MECPARPTSPEPRITLQVACVTPEQAREWLLLSGLLRGQPAPRPARGVRWLPRGMTIKFGRSGALLDGQRCLQRIVETGQAARLTILRGLDDASFAALESRSARKIAQALGKLGEGNTATLTEALRGLWCQRRRYPHTFKAPGHELLELLELEPGLRDSVAWVCKRRWDPALGSRGTLALCHHLFHELEPDLGETFFQRLHDGAELAPGEPVRALRRYLRDPRGPLTEGERIALFFRCWNAHVRGQRLRTLRTPRVAQGAPTVPALVSPRALVWTPDALAAHPAPFHA